MTINIVSNPDYFDFAELVAEFVSDQRTVLRLTNSIVDKTNEVVHREVFDALDDATHPFRSLIQEQEQELQSVYGSLHAERADNDSLRQQLADKRDDLHEVLVNVCRTSEVIVGFVAETKKINAIKELRRLTNASLKASKEAVEDPRVWSPPMFEVVGVAYVGTD